MLIEIDNLQKDYTIANKSQSVLKNIDLKINAGEFVYLLLTQGEDRDYEDQSEVFDAITTSLIQYNG